MKIEDVVITQNFDVTTFTLDEGSPRSHYIISSVRVARGVGHDIVSVWNRGGLAGTLTVNRGDGDKIAERLLTTEQEIQDLNERVGILLLEKEQDRIRILELS